MPSSRLRASVGVKGELKSLLCLARTHRTTVRAVDPVIKPGHVNEFATGRLGLNFFKDRKKAGLFPRAEQDSGRTKLTGNALTTEVV
jgi:hypothetical protein